MTLPARVEKIIPGATEKAQIGIEQGADHLYEEIRIENELTDEEGNELKLKKGANVDVTVEADPSRSVPENEESR